MCLLVIGVLLGCLSVTFGACAEHGLLLALGGWIAAGC